MLGTELFIGERLYQQQRSGASLEKLAGYGSTIYPRSNADCGHGFPHSLVPASAPEVHFQSYGYFGRSARYWRETVRSTFNTAVMR